MGVELISPHFLRQSGAAPSRVLNLGGLEVLLKLVGGGDRLVHFPYSGVVTT